MPWNRYVLGYHGCDAGVARKIAAGDNALKPSANDYDWLGHGLYFWEESFERAVREGEDQPPFDTVRAFFTEGEPLYPTAGIRQLDHVPIRVRNPACIAGYFLPLKGIGS